MGKIIELLNKIIQAIINIEKRLEIIEEYLTK